MIDHQDSKTVALAADFVKQFLNTRGERFARMNHEDRAG